MSSPNFYAGIRIILLMIPAGVFAQVPSANQIKAWEQQAKQVTIIRDTWGVPHLYGKTDADCVFGIAYAQAEDNMEQVEDNFIRAIGRGAEIHGEESLASDQMINALELLTLAKKEYAVASPILKKLLDSYAAGINYYLYKNKQYRPVLLTNMQPWYPLALIRYFYYYNDILLMAGINTADIKANFVATSNNHNTGSNAWAIGKGKTATGTAMLFLNPHRPLFGNGTFNEAQVESESGWKFSGATKFGFPLLYMGHNGTIGYGYTVNYPDMGDQYLEKFDHPTDSLMYKFGNGYKKAVAWKQTIMVKNKTGVEKRTYRFVKTHHGPIVKKINGQPVSVRLAGIEKQGWLLQWYEMSKAQDLTSFKIALSPIALPYLNVLYGDKQGNTYFLYNVASAKRKPGHDFTKPVDGSNPDTDWQGYHGMEELPQLTNPASGFLQSCNSDISLTAGPGSIDKNVFPNYMVGNEYKNPRAMRSVSILQNEKLISFERWSALATDTYCQLAEDSLKVSLQILESSIQEEPGNSEMRPLIDSLRNWDGYANGNSIGMTIFREMFNYHRADGSSFIKALARTKATLEKNWGTWQVPWGNRSRLQKIDWNETAFFNDDSLSFPLLGAPQSYGTIFCNSYGNSKAQQTPSDAKLRYITSGNTYTSVIELGTQVRARSIMPFGQQETGPHSMDQTPLFIKGQFKDAWFYKKDVLANARRTYHPGE